MTARGKGSSAVKIPMIMMTIMAIAKVRLTNSVLRVWRLRAMT
jgi:hypothetical protein